MKIGVYDPYLDDLGGGEKYMMSIAECLAKDNSVDIFWDNQQDLDTLQKRFGLNLSTVNRVPNIFSSNTNILKRFFLTRIYDAVIVLSDGSIPLVGAKKLFLHIQQPLPVFQNRLIDTYKLSRVKRIFCNSEYTKSFVDKKTSISTMVIYPPVTLHKKNVKKGNIILHVGRFRVIDPIVGVDDYKKQGIMIEVFKKMVDNGLGNWKFVLAVSVQEKDNESFERMKLSAKGYPIEFLVNKKNDELWDIYSVAKIYWHASGYGENLVTHPEFAEHFGISTVEAMGAGAVPVVFNAGGQKEIVTDGVDGLVWNTVVELEEKTKGLIENASLINRLAVEAQKRAEDFGPEQFCEKILQLVNT